MKEHLVYISELTKNVSVSNSPNINITALTKGDSSPLFMTLPIAEVGGRSKNGLLYDEQLVSEIEQQIKAGGKTGIFGHIPDGEEAHAFPLPDVYWVGAQRIGKQLFAKGYLATQRAREFYERAGAALIKAATSIYGLGKRQPKGDGTHTLAEFTLQSLDFAPHDRAALPLSGEFALTAEMRDYAYVTATIRVPVLPTSNSADVMATVQQALSGVQTTLGSSATISLTAEESYSPDEAAQTLEIAQLKGQLAVAQNQIRELQQPIAISEQLQPRVPFNMTEHNAVLRHWNATRNGQTVVDGYIKLLMETMSLEAAHKEAIKELSKPRKVGGQPVVTTPTQSDWKREIERMKSDEGIAEIHRKFGSNYAPPPAPAPTQPTWNREFATSPEGIAELKKKFGISNPNPEEIAAARRRVGL